MRKLMFFCVAVSFFISTDALCQVKTDTDCTNASSQLETYKCLSKQYTNTDKELNVIYGKILSKLTKEKNTKAINILKESQRSWIAFRNKFGKVYQEYIKEGRLCLLQYLNVK